MTASSPSLHVWKLVGLRCQHRRSWGPLILASERRQRTQAPRLSAGVRTMLHWKSGRCCQGAAGREPSANDSSSLIEDRAPRRRIVILESYRMLHNLAELLSLTEQGPSCCNEFKATSGKQFSRRISRLVSQTVSVERVPCG